MMKRYITLVMIVLMVAPLVAQQATFKLPAFSEGDVEPGTLILKVKDAYRSQCTDNGINNPALNSFFASIGSTGVAKIFPKAQQPDKKLYAQAEKPADITLIYRLKYSAAMPMLKIINSLMATGMFVYVEPNFIQKPCYTSNDPQRTNQWYIGQLKANLAWDITRGDTNMVIGVTDSGVDTNHVDLKSNIKYNYNDPRNGIDDDGDGYVDNYRGWNMWAGTDNVYDAEDSHGTFCTGISSAKADNSLGITGLAFNCKFLPVRVDDNHGSYIRCYEGVVYAADHGCKVINCSWGSRYACNFGYDIVTYAAVNKDAVVVASAGNDNTAQPFYPASYQYVLNVGGVQQSNIKSNSSSFGVNLDLVAYGSGVYSTYNPNTYTTSGGTSASAPMVSAAAALVRVYNPTWSALKVAEQVKVTADASIYAVGGNSTFINKLGRGLLNMQKALNDTSSASIVMLNKRVTDGNDGNFFPGDTLRIAGVFKNYIRPASAVSVTISSTSPYITILNNTFLLGNLNQNDTVSNYNQPFKAVIAANTPAYTPVEFKLTITSGTYTALEWVLDTLNRDIANIDVGNVILTMTSKGAIGFNNDSNTGYGFTYKDSGPLFYSSSLMVGSANGAGTRKVMNTTYGSIIPNYDDDWAKVSTIKKRPVSLTSDKDLVGKFDDSNAGSNRVNVTVEQRGFGWAGLDEKFVIVEYCIRPNGQNIDSLAVGIFTDWDILTYVSGNSFFNTNNIGIDNGRKLMYASNTAPQSIYAGVRLLTLQNPNYYALNSDGTSGSISIYNGFSTDEKYNTIAGLQQRTSTTTGDVSAVLGVGPISLAAADSFKFAVAYVAGDNLADIQAQSDTAFARYWNYVWTGYENTVWNNSGNWNWYRVPTSQNDALVPANPVNLPNVGNYTAGVHNLNIVGPSTVSQTGQNSVLEITGNLTSTNGGGVDATQGAVNFTGTSQQTISGTHSVNTLNLNNSTGLKNTAGSTLTVRGRLNLILGDLTNNGILNKE